MIGGGSSIILILFFVGMFSEEINIFTGKIPRGGIYKIESVDGDTIEVRRLLSNTKLQETNSWKFEDKTSKVSLSKFYEMDRLDPPIEGVKKGEYFLVWKHHAKDINLMALSESTSKEDAFKEWRSMFNW